MKKLAKLKYMKQKFLHIVPILAVALVFSPTTYAVSFTQHVDSDGKLITTNLPESCVSDGVLICYEYYSVMHTGPIPVYRKAKAPAGQASPLESVSQQLSSSKKSASETASEEAPVAQSPTALPDEKIICDAGDDKNLEKSKDFYPFLTEDNCAEMIIKRSQY